MCSSSAAFPSTLFIPFFPSLSCTGSRRASGLGELHQAPGRALVRAERYDEKCLSVITGSHSPEALAALSRRPSDHRSTLDNYADEVPGFLGRRKLIRANTLDAGAPLSFLQVS
jgi:hypothetical protein